MLDAFCPPRGHTSYGTLAGTRISVAMIMHSSDVTAINVIASDASTASFARPALVFTHFTGTFPQGRGSTCSVTV
jgi:hypothetical protein